MVSSFRFVKTGLVNANPDCFYWSVVSKASMAIGCEVI